VAELGVAGRVPFPGVACGRVSSFPETSPWGVVVVLVVEALDDDPEFAGAELE
jgi:hypothetical protein